MTERVVITSRDGKRLVLLVDHPVDSRGVAFVAHSLGGTKNDADIAMFARTCVEGNFTAVRWDVRNTFGESEGVFADATATNYLEDMEDVIAWARLQPWFIEPFLLCGHSLGAFCCLIYAERYPQQVLGLAPFATVISGELSMEHKIAEVGQATVDSWKESGWIESSSNPLRKRRYAELEDRLKYDTLRAAHKLHMPKLFIVGENDPLTPVRMQQRIVDAVPEPKEFHVVAGASHTYRTENDIAAVRSLLSAWLAKHWPR